MPFAKAACLVLLLSLVALAGCTGPTTPSSTETADASHPCAGKTRAAYPTVPANHTIVAISSTVGCMVAELFDDKAPITVTNFKTYVTEGFYKDRQFYRIITGFMSQGGGERQGATGNHPAIKNEAKASHLSNTKYTLSMARLGPACQTGCPDQPDSATTEFFVNAADNTFLDPGGNSVAGYAVFGRLVDGLTVADTLNTMASTKPVPTFAIATLS